MTLKSSSSTHGAPAHPGAVGSNRKPLRAVLLAAGAAVLWLAAGAVSAQVLNVLKTDGVGTYEPGQSLTYTITVTNTGPLATTGVTLTDIMSSQFARYDYNSQFFNGATLAGGSASGSGTALSGSPGTITFNVNLPTTGRVEIIVQAIVRTSAAGAINNNIVATGGTPAISGTTSFNDGNSQAGVPPIGYNFPLCSATGQDGPKGASTANEVVNTYWAPPASTATLPSASRCLPIDTSIGSAGAFGALTPALAAGHRLLVIQMQDGTFTTTDSTAYGAGASSGRGFTSRGAAGNFEYVQVDGAIGSGVHGCGLTEIPITGVSGSPTSGTPTLGLFNTYTNAPNAITLRDTVQYVRVPQYTDLTFSLSGSFDSFPWQGRVGGVVVVDASGTIDFGPTAGLVRINALAAGFRGGGTNEDSIGSGANSLYRIDLLQGHGTKGEGIVGTPLFVFNGISSSTLTFEGYANGASGRGAPGNAGGGGNSCNSADNSQESGGGGGGHGGNGGLGGNCNVGALNVGGTGGGAFPFLGSENLAGARISGFGGGGGAGVRSSGLGTDSAGGPGGGLVLINGNRFIGAGNVSAIGGAGQSAGTNGGGGGGAGGMIVLLANLSAASNFGGVVLQADGGPGGSANIAAPALPITNRFGPGGGGAGGRIYTSESAVGLPNIQVSGGDRGGTTVSLTNFGAQNGDSGSQFSVLNPYNATLGVKPGFLCQGGTIPVTLSSVSSKVVGDELVVSFSTATEAGALGFRLHQDLAGDSVRRLASEEVLKAAGESSLPKQYVFRTAYVGQEKVFIEELSSNGRSEMYGPYPVGRSVGEVDLTVTTDWAKIGVEQKAAREASVAETVTRNRSVDLVAEFKVATDGLYRVSYEQLVAAGIQWAGVSTAQIQLSRNGSPVSASVQGGSLFGPGSVVEFYGQSLKGSLYTNASVYQLRANHAAAANSSAFAGAGALSSVDSFRSTVSKAPNERYSFASPTADPWFWTSVTRTGGAPVAWEGSFDVINRAASSTDERLVVDLWGGTTVAATPDHRFKVYVNNQLLTTSTFDGLTAHQVDVSIPQGTLVNGSNTLKLELIVADGAVAPFDPDRINVEGVSVQYDRELKLPASGRLVITPSNSPATASSDSMFADTFSSEGAASCRSSEVGCQAFEVSGVSGPAVVMLERGSALKQLTGVRVVGNAARFAVATQAGDRLYVEQRSSALAANVSPVAPMSDPLAGGSATFLMISHPSFASRLAPLVEARQAQGYSVRVVNVEDLYRAYNNGVFDPIAIDRALADAYTRLGTRAALLVGGDSSDYKNYVVSNAISFIPTQYRRTSEFMAYAPVDALYADINDDNRGDILLGRFPVRSFAELDAVVAKTIAYGNQPASNRGLFIADRTRNNAVDFGSINAQVAGYLAPNWAVSTINFDSYPIDQNSPGAWAVTARNDIVSSLNSGKGLTVYTGHSAISSWSQNGLLTASLVNGGLLSSAPATALLQIGCYGTYFVEPTTSSLAASLLTASGSAAVVIGTTGLTEVEDGANLASEFLPEIRDQQSVGEALRRAQSDILTREPTMMDIVIGSNILGDPTLKIR